MNQHSIEVLRRCVLLGVLAGIRSFSAPGLVFAGRAGRLFALVAVGEMIGDKLPGIPPRTDPLPLLGRGLSAALSVYSYARKERFLAGIPISVASAGISAVFFTQFRKVLRESFSIPDQLIGVLEDVLVLSLARQTFRVSALRLSLANGA